MGVCETPLGLQNNIAGAHRSLLFELVAVQLVSDLTELLFQLQVLAHVLCSCFKVASCQCSPAQQAPQAG